MDRTDLLEKTYLKVSDMLKYSEAKNISIIAVNSAIFVLYATIFKIMYPSASVLYDKKIQFYSYLISIFLILISSFLSLLSIVPKYIRIRTYTGQKYNYIFYADISKKSYMELLNRYDEYTEKPNEYDEDLAYSIVSISQISSNKNNLFFFSCISTFCSLMAYFLFYVWP